MIVEMFRQSGYLKTAEAAETGVQTEMQTSDMAGTSSAPPFAQSVLPRI